MSLRRTDLDEMETRILLWTSVGGSSSGRTSVSGSDYLGSIPSPPANNVFHAFPDLQIGSVPRWGIV